jgi:hypothetical protein
MVKKDNQDLPATTESQDIFERFDEIDDKVILKELENQVVDDWVYHFVVEGHHIWGLGKVGIDACTRKMGEKGVALREDYVNYGVDPTNPEYVLFTASVSKHVVGKAGAEATIESAIGTKRQWTILRRKIQGEYKLVPNKFWFEQGSQKALRNAKARLIPDEIKTKVIEFAKTHKKVKEIDAPVAQKRPDTTPEPEKKPESSKSPPESEKKPESSTSNSPPVKEEFFFPDDKERGLGFPPETKEEPQVEMPTHKERMELTGLEATLVDAYGATPDQVCDKLKEMFGEDELTKLNKEQTLKGIKYFKGVIESKEKDKQKK